MRGKNTVEDWAEIDDILRVYPDGDDKDSLVERAECLKNCLLYLHKRQLIVLETALVILGGFMVLLKSVV